MTRSLCNNILYAILVMLLAHGEVTAQVPVSNLASLSMSETEVIISDPTLTTVTKGMVDLPNLVNVDTLRFENNPRLEEIKPDTLPESVQNLEIHETNALRTFPNLSALYLLVNVVIQYSQIDYIPESYVSNLTYLEILDLSNNQFATFPIAIGTLPFLRDLNLNHNKIEYVNVSGLNPSYTLSNLKMKSNTMKSFPAVSVFPVLQVLELSDNLIPSAPWSQALSPYHPPVPDMSMLNTLWLNRNPMPVPADFSLFEHVPNLNALIMAFCNLTAIPPALKAAHRLVEIYFNFNSITHLPADIVTASSKIKKIYLPGNLLTSLPGEAFKEANDLDILDLSNNQFTTLSSQILHETRKFVVEMAGNPLRCDRSLCWIKEHDPYSGQAFDFRVGTTPCTNFPALTFDQMTATDLGCTGPLTLTGNTDCADVYEKTTGNNNDNLYSLSTLEKHGRSLIMNTTYVDSPSCALGCLLHGSECTGFAIDAVQNMCWLLVKG